MSEIMFRNQYRGAKVFVTGHTGFKGSWLVLWLEMLGAEVTGYALEPPTHPNHINLLQLCGESLVGDVRDLAHLKKAILEKKPDLVFHLAAQPLVRYSYQHPVETFETNIMGTVNLLEACRSMEFDKGIVIVTSDKCYENSSMERGFYENDRLGGDDPYSSSKGCAELVTASYRNSFFSNSTASKTISQVASVRAGNVIGGGDWGENRLIPDIIRAVERQEPITLRNPDSIRPWQHVLDALSGYLLIGQRMLERQSVDSAWNFGPGSDSHLTVREIVEMVKKMWGAKMNIRQVSSNLMETAILRLDTTKARSTLGWKPKLDVKESVRQTVEWYQAFCENKTVLTERQIRDYMNTTTMA